MRLIHLGTRITAEFGVMDESGDIIQRIPIQADLPKLDAIILGEAVEAIQIKRAEIAAQVEEAEKTEGAVSPPKEG